jgi:hypothetical protein
MYFTTYKISITYILFYELYKNDKLWVFLEIWITILRFTYLLWLCSPKYKLFLVENLHVYEIQYWLHHDLFQIFLQLRNMIFNYFSKKGSMVFICTKPLSSFETFLCYLNRENGKTMCRIAWWQKKRWWNTIACIDYFQHHVTTWGSTLFHRLALGVYGGTHI